MQSFPGAQDISQVIEADAERVRSGTVQADCASRFYPSTSPHPPRAVVLMLHGFAGGTYQCDDLGNALAQAGLHAYAPRLPGHGGATPAGERNFADLPASRDTHRYRAFARHALADVADLAHATGAPVGVLGFSLGGSLALDLALHSPQTVNRLMLAAPLLRRAALRARHLHVGVHLGKLLGARRLYDYMPYSWGPAPPPDEMLPGNWHFRLGHLYAALAYARQVHRPSITVSVPTRNRHHRGRRYVRPQRS